MLFGGFSGFFRGRGFSKRYRVCYGLAVRGSLLWFLVLSCLLTFSSLGAAKTREHTVGKGQTLGKIAHRYHVSVSAICNANDIERSDPIKPGQKLLIPDKDDENGDAARKEREAKERKRKPSKPKPAPKEDAKSERKSADDSGLQLLEVAGGSAYYSYPTGPGRKSLRPVLMYMHARSGDPRSDCARWAKVASNLGWVVCPVGPEDRGGGRRGWANNWATGHRAAMASLNALREKHGRRVQLYGNTLIGFSEGAFVTMNVGVREPRAFNRWLVLAADTKYWGGQGLEELGKNHARIRRVYLITGKEDGTYEPTLTVKGWLNKAKVPVRISTPADMGHELLLESKRGMYRAALVWLTKG